VRTLATAAGAMFLAVAPAAAAAAAAMAAAARGGGVSHTVLSADSEVVLKNGNTPGGVGAAGATSAFGVLDVEVTSVNVVSADDECGIDEIVETPSGSLLVLESPLSLTLAAK